MRTMRTIDADALKEALKSNCKPELCHDYNTAWCESCCPHNDFEDLIDNAPTIAERPQGEYVDISKLRLMTVEECAGHTIDYAMGWKACIEWIKKGGAE